MYICCSSFFHSSLFFSPFCLVQIVRSLGQGPWLRVSNTAHKSNEVPVLTVPLGATHINTTTSIFNTMVKCVPQRPPYLNYSDIFHCCVKKKYSLCMKMCSSSFSKWRTEDAWPCGAEYSVSSVNKVSGSCKAREGLTCCCDDPAEILHHYILMQLQ